MREFFSTKNKSLYPNLSSVGRLIPAGIALSVLTCAINSTFAQEMTDQGSAGTTASTPEASKSASTANEVTDLGAVGATASVPEAAKSAPSQNSLSARSAQSEISDEYIRNFISPIADYSQVVLMSPGIISFSPNGIGLGDMYS